MATMKLILSAIVHSWRFCKMDLLIVHVRLVGYYIFSKHFEDFGHTGPAAQGSVLMPLVQHTIWVCVGIRIYALLHHRDDAALEVLASGYLGGEYPCYLTFRFSSLSSQDFFHQRIGF